MKSFLKSFKVSKIDRKFRLSRIWSNSEIKKISGLFSGRVINVSAGENIDKEGSHYDQYFINASEFWISNFSPGSFRGFRGGEKELLIDLTSDLPQEYNGQFDVVFNHTTLEHVFDIFKAFNNICSLSKDIVIIIVPFIQEQHESADYLDYWRFTPSCIRKLFEINSLTVIYESANSDFNAAVYLFFVASRYPELWRNKMPKYDQLKNVGNWIGT